MPLKNETVKQNAIIFALSSIIIVLLAGFSTLFVGETERIWLYFTPLLSITAAITLNNWYKNKGMILYGYVIMSNHIHLIIQTNDSKLSDLIRDFKKFTAKSILQKIITPILIMEEFH